jgi:hypothetical protein
MTAGLAAQTTSRCSGTTCSAIAAGTAITAASAIAGDAAADEVILDHRVGDAAQQDAERPTTADSAAAAFAGATARAAATTAAAGAQHRAIATGAAATAGTRIAGIGGTPVPGLIEPGGDSAHAHAAVAAASAVAAESAQSVLTAARAAGATTALRMTELKAIRQCMSVTAHGADAEQGATAAAITAGVGPCIGVGCRTATAAIDAGGIRAVAAVGVLEAVRAVLPLAARTGDDVIA